MPEVRIALFCSQYETWEPIQFRRGGVFLKILFPEMFIHWKTALLDWRALYCHGVRVVQKMTSFGQVSGSLAWHRRSRFDFARLARVLASHPFHPRPAPQNPHQAAQLMIQSRQPRYEADTK
jgi:hypothetical protein